MVMRAPLVLCGVLPLVLAVAAPAQLVLQEHEGSKSGFGQEVDGGGDADGDGVPDVLVADGATSSSAVHLFSGADGSTLATFAVDGKSGLAVAFVGDLDLDGHVDLAIGQPAAARFDVHSGDDGAVLLGGDSESWYFGGDIAPAGDVDADGTPDLIVGSRADGLLDVGGDTVRVVSGATGATLHEVNLFNPFWFPQGLGWTVSALGDVDRDGHADVAVAIPLKGLAGHPFASGVVEVRSGADFSVLFVLAGEAEHENLGVRMAAPGDVDGDGVADLACATRHGVGGVKLFSGADGSLLHAIEVTGGPGAPYPLDVAAAGDLDGDGVADLAVGSPGALRLHSSTTGGLLFQAGGYEPGAVLHSAALAVAGAGDVDGDGRADIVVGAPAQPQHGADGLVHVISGIAAPFTLTGTGVAGVDAVPELAGTGTLQPGSPGQLLFRHGAPAALSFLVVGLQAWNAPFAGGTFVPSLDLLHVLATDAAGNWTASWAAWPAGVPPYTHLWLQAFTQDAAAVGGLSATQGLHVVTP